ncbi:MAG: hypothetical protein WBV06_03290 [Acidimicrobiia bacterium]
MLESANPDQVTVEAPTVEDALAEISAQFGEDAEIMRAQKVHRGGVGGFFAKEMVQLTARRRRTAAPAQFRPPSRPQGGGIADVLERMAQSADAEDSDFRTVLQRELAVADEDGGVAALPAPEPLEDSAPEVHFVPPFADEVPEPVVVGPALLAVTDPEPAEDARQSEVAPTDPEVETPAVVFPALLAVEVTEAAGEDYAEPAPVDERETAPDQDMTVADGDTGWWRTAEPIDAPHGMGRIAWSTTALLRLGLPAPIIAAVTDLDGNDDMGWIDRIAATVAPHCGPLPEGDVIVVGPHAERLAEPLGLPLIRSGDMAPYAGSFCAMVDDTPADRQWLEFVRGGRGIHLVIGDERWQDLLIGEPVAVSWVGETAVADALYLAFTLGATLGYGTVDGFVSSMVRAQPTDVALAVRRMVGRR